MALPFLIGYHRLTKTEKPEDIYAAHTCPNDGFVYAWGDPIDGALIWFLPACPVDAVLANLTTNIANFVNNAYNYQVDDDPHRRILAIIAAAKADAKNWLSQHTTEEIANFLGTDARLQSLIFAELVRTGAVA